MRKPRAISLESKKSTAILTREVCGSLDEQAVLEGKPANIIVAELISNYLDQEDKKIYSVPAYDSETVKSRFLMIDDQLWSRFKVLKTTQGRPLGRILEQLLRIYVGMEVGDEVDPQKGKTRLKR